MESVESADEMHQNQNNESFNDNPTKKFKING